MPLTRTRNFRKVKNFLFKKICVTFSFLMVIILITLLTHIVIQALPWLSIDFLLNTPSRLPEKSGILAGIVGSLWLMIFTFFIAIPIGVLTAIYLEEYASNNVFKKFLEVNIANLAGVPSIVYGLIGLAIFVRYLGFGRSIISCSLTLSLLILPVIIISSKSAISSFPNTIKEASFALGARKWQVILTQVIPGSLPGILTGVIISISRAMGETAPLIIIGASAYVSFVPLNPFDSFTAIPIQIYSWASKPNEDFHGVSASGIVVFLILLVIFNSINIYIRKKSERYRF